jgi:hypothetical protein
LPSRREPRATASWRGDQEHNDLGHKSAATNDNFATVSIEARRLAVGSDAADAAAASARQALQAGLRRPAPAAGIGAYTINLDANDLLIEDDAETGVTEDGDARCGAGLFLGSGAICPLRRAT